MNVLIRKCIGAGQAVGWYVLETIDEIGDFDAGLEGLWKKRVTKSARKGKLVSV